MNGSFGSADVQHGLSAGGLENFRLGGGAIVEPDHHGKGVFGASLILYVMESGESLLRRAGGKLQDDVDQMHAWISDDSAMVFLPYLPVGPFGKGSFSARFRPAFWLN